MDLKPFGEKAHNFILAPIGQDSRITILEGAVRSSKTVAMIPKLISLVLTGPKGLGVITGVSKDTIYDNVLRDLFEIIGGSNFSYNRQSGELNLLGAEAKVIGAKDEGSEKYIRGKTVAWAYCDELSLMPERFFKQLLNRMSVPGARLYGTTNPDTPFHYLYREFITDQAKLDSGMVKVIHFELDDNPTLTDEYKRFIRQAYSGVFYQRFIEGKWVVAEGVIYRDCWSDDWLFNDETIPVGLATGYAQRYVGIDFGTHNPTVFLEVLDDGQTLWVVREHYYDPMITNREKSPSEHADDLVSFVAGNDDSEIVMDPAAAHFEVELRNRGIIARDADNEVLEGIRLVSSMMKRGFIRVHERCEHLRAELATYCWDEKKALKGEEAPLKQNDHLCDALRYICKTMINPWRLAA